MYQLLETNLHLLISGVSAGCVYGLVAMGFVLIYKATEMVNFSQGELVMLGAFFVVTFFELFQGNYFLAVGATILVMGLLGYSLDRVLFRRMVGEPPFAILMVTIGLGFVLRAVAGMIWGHNPQILQAPYSDMLWLIGGVQVPVSDLVVIAGTLTLSLLLTLFFRQSRLGLSMQAVSQNQLASFYVGISVKRIVGLTWALSAMIAAIAGVLLVPIKSAYPSLGLFLGIKAFAAAIVGGFGSLVGALIGGLSIGVIESFTEYHLDQTVGFALSDMSAYLLLLLMLLLRPAGLIGSLQKKKV